MGKPTGFMEYKREVSVAEDPKKRIQHFNEFHEHLPKEKQRLQGARCMECGVPFCQSGMMICGMASGCPLHNLVPEWNDLVYTGNWQQAYNRLKKTNNFPEFTSRVCPALCEAACTCGLNGDPVSTKENEYAIIENAYSEGYAAAKPPVVRTGKKVAVIGAVLPDWQQQSAEPERTSGNSIRAFRSCGRTVDVRHPQHETGKADH